MPKTALHKLVLEVLKDKPTRITWKIEAEPGYVILFYSYLPWTTISNFQIEITTSRQGKLPCDFFVDDREPEHFKSLEEALGRADFFFQELKTHLDKESYGVHNYE